MKNFMNLVLMCFFMVSKAMGLVSVPDAQLTPGVICTASDPDFSGLDYPSKVARCNRNISTQEKTAVAISYGNIPQSEWRNYEFDHYYPLCAGGSNSQQNLWPQPIDQAKKKDVVEVEVCTGLRAGTMTQDQALQKIRDWFQNNTQASIPVSPAATTAFLSLDSVSNSQNYTEINKFICNEVTSIKDKQSRIKLNFELLEANKISGLEIKLIEQNSEHDFLNISDMVFTGKTSKGSKPPLDHLLLFSIKSSDDHFYFYLPEDFGASNPVAFFKISFNGTLPALLRMNCQQH